jgi:hypothetical protein
VGRRPEEITVKEAFKNISEGKESVGNPRRRWLDNFANELNKMGVIGWIKIAKDTDAWKLILKVASVLLRP